TRSIDFQNSGTSATLSDRIFFDFVQQPGFFCSLSVAEGRKKIRDQSTSKIRALRLRSVTEFFWLHSVTEFQKPIFFLTFAPSKNKFS
ncbi:MAG: hypothetical protein WBB36_16120, partial [Chitinophagales bacterium]